MTRIFPGEWERHRGTVVAWPRRPETWGMQIEAAHAEYSALVKEIAESEEVLVVVHPEDLIQARPLTTYPNVRIMVFEIDDGWIRDNGPIFCHENGSMVAVDFDFNSWGNRFNPSDGDRAVSSAICQHYNTECVKVPWVLEGGAISSNGAGALLLSAECVLQPNRNEGSSRTSVQELLGSALGIGQFIWVPYGLLEDLRNTDGHVDNVAVFCGPTTVLVQTVDIDNPNHDRLKENVSSIRLADPGLEVIECSSLPYTTLVDGSVQPAPYLNFVLTNESVLLPTVGSDDDSWATGFFREIFPDRRIAFVPARVLTFGGGGPHCVTMQVPA